MRRFLYFAYGSNLLSTRLGARCPSARVIGKAKTKDYCVEFTKLSHRDGSGKASLDAMPGAIASGVVFEVSADERGALDQHEGLGLGYDRVNLSATLANGTVETVATYIGTNRRADLQPFDWYLALILAGAAEHALDRHHVGKLAAVPTYPDPTPERETRIAAIDALRAAGHHRWQDLLPETG